MSEKKDIIFSHSKSALGRIHPINNMKDHIMLLLEDLGFEIISGPEIESEEYNFDMLNIKKSHPARQMHDTFYVENKSQVLRTHTSPVQIRGMLHNKPPIAFISGGKVFRKDVSNCYLRSESRVIAALGVENLIIVENNDSVLVINKSSTQQVKLIVQELEKGGFVEGKSNSKVFRPWGNFTSIATEERWQVKRIEVKPGASLSLQMHHHRSEHWIIVTGTALVEIDQKKELFTENQSVYIPIGCKHRLSNPGKLHLVLIEVQSGA